MSTLKARYSLLVNTTLPDKANKDGTYPVAYNHCFARIALDSIYNDKWSNHIEKPAIHNMTSSEFITAIFWLEQMLNSANVCKAMNKMSLICRGKA